MGIHTAQAGWQHAVIFCCRIDGNLYLGARRRCGAVDISGDQHYAYASVETDPDNDTRCQIRGFDGMRCQMNV